MSGRALFVFNHDLRLRDHAGLAAAARHGAVVPALVIDASLAARLRRSPRRAAFFCAAVRALDADLRARGAHLIVRRGPAGSTARALARAAGAGAVGWSLSYDAKGIQSDRDVQSRVEEAGLRAVPAHDAPVIAPEDTAVANRRGDGYRAFVPYYARWKAQIPAPAFPDAAFDPADIASEALPDPAEFGAVGEREPRIPEATGLEALDAFLQMPVLHFAIARNVPSIGGTSRLAAHLSFGTLAARGVVRAACARAADPFLLVEEQASIKTFLRALAQRDFFLQLGWHSESLAEGPLQPKMRDFRFARTHRDLDAWRSGRTGYPLVDAGMRQLRATGWMHPRVRTIAASFLCFDLGVDWRVGRDDWEQWLIEDAPALATGNWQWIAGVGADLAAYPRIYNPLKQARRFDPAAEYIRTWIPELAGHPDDAILHPASARANPQLQLALFGNGDYPAPIVDHEAAARAFLERYSREVRAVTA
ncbi:MAG: deoxyribodipyrimidine photo-lyase [Candidatus Velthaea sp.]